MTTGESDSSMYEINPDLEGLSQFIPPIDVPVSILPPEITQVEPINLVTEEVVEALRREMKPVFAGPEMLGILRAGEESWGEDTVVQLPLEDSDKIEMGEEEHLVKSDMSPADVAAAIEKVVRPS